jgi:type II secretory pathway pseudopilin PulG
MTTPFQQRKERESGFTLIEAIVAMGIMSAIGLAIVTFQMTVVRDTKVIQSNLGSDQEVRKTLKLFTQEIRQAAPSASGSFAIEAAGTSSVVFFANIDKSSDIERVRYFLATSTQGSSVHDVIRKGVTKPSGTVYNLGTETLTTLVRDVKNAPATPLFTYYNSGYSGTSTALTIPVDLPSVRLVRFEVIVDPNAGRSPIPRTYTTQVSLRNLKSNL